MSLIINERNIKLWSTIGPRATLGIGALELAKEIENLMVLTCDVSTSAGLDRFRKSFPDKYLRFRNRRTKYDRCSCWTC